MQLKDISLFFSIKSTCCTKAGMANPCPSHAQKSDPFDFFRTLDASNTLLPFYMTTITIGNKHYGRMSSEEQYKHFCAAIKKHVKYHNDKGQRYIYVFELQRNGQLHAHGLEVGTSQAQFIESFHKFGSRNMHDKSFQTVKRLETYIKYMQKEEVYPRIHNIKKKDLLKSPP